MTTELKARVLDLQDDNDKLRKAMQEMQEVLLKVATNLGVEPDENNQISLDAILSASNQQPEVDQLSE